MSVEADTPAGHARAAGTKSAAQSPARAAQVLMWGAFGLLLYEAHVAFVPIALALLLALVLSGPVEALHRLRVPRGVSALLILLVTLALIGTTVEVLWNPAQHWFASAPQTLPELRQSFVKNDFNVKKLAVEIAVLAAMPPPTRA